MSKADRPERPEGFALRRWRDCSSALRNRGNRGDAAQQYTTQKLLHRGFLLVGYATGLPGA